MTSQATGYLRKSGQPGLIADRMIDKFRAILVYCLFIQKSNCCKQEHFGNAQITSDKVMLSSRKPVHRVTLSLFYYAVVLHLLMLSSALFSRCRLIGMLISTKQGTIKTTAQASVALQKNRLETTRLSSIFFRIQ